VEESQIPDIDEASVADIPLFTEEPRKQRIHRRRQIVVRTYDEQGLSRRDIHPETDEFREISAHDVDVHGKTMDDDILYLDFKQTDGPHAGQTCRMTIWAARGRWPWSAPVQMVRVEYDFH
jgi:hypothetical protein